MMISMKIETITLKPLPNFSKEIGYYVAGIEAIRRDWREKVKDLNNGQLATKILPDIQPIGTMIIHLAEAEYWWTQCVIEGKEFTQEIKDLLHHDLWFKDFSVEDLDANYCLETVDKIHEMSVQTLSIFKDEDLEKFFVRSDNSNKYSLRRILHNLYDHEATHKGQILMIKRVLLGTTNILS